MKKNDIIAVAVLAFLCGCVSDSGFVPLNKAKVAETIDIGDEAKGDINKPITETNAPEQGWGLQVINEEWSTAILLCGLLFIREMFSYLRMRLKP